MKVKFGLVIVDGSGKLGGHVVTQTKAGKAIRTKATPVNRSSNTQQGVKAIFSANAQAFRSLTAAQITAWNAAAKDWTVKNYFGDVVQLSGMALYQRLNSNLAKVGAAAIANPPTQVAIGAVAALVITTLTAAVMTATFTPSPVTAGFALLWEATRSVSPGVSYVKNQFRVIDKTAAAGTSPADLYAGYAAVFGAPILGKKVYLRGTLVNITTGQTGVSAQASLVVTA